MPTEIKPLRPYLIQRGKFKTALLENAESLASILDFDYMGSSEFEWGAIPKAFQSMCKSLGSKAITPVKDIRHRDGRVMHLICDPDRVEQLSQFLRDEVKGGFEHRLKESTYLEYVFITDPKAMFYSLGQRVDFWWDIDNDWMATLGKRPADLVMIALNKIKARKGW